MTVFTSRIELGKMYKDPRTGIEGHANAVFFQEHGCVEAQIEYMQDKKPELIIVNELRLTTPNDATLESAKHEYETDLVLGHEYEDIQTKLRGHLGIVEFHEYMATRGDLRRVATDTKGRESVTYLSVDDFLLKDLETEQVAEPKTAKRSPVTHEVTRR